MSLRLKSHTEACPNGFIYVQSQTGWQSWVHAPNSKWDWNQLLLAVQAHRLSNPKLGLPTDLPTIERELDYVNALRVSAMRGGKSYVTDDERPPPPKSQALPLTARLASVVEGAAKLRSGLATLTGWNLEQDPPVDRAQANFRAATCVACPQNGTGNFGQWFTEPISKALRLIIGGFKERNLATSYDDRLGVCRACLCPMALKVWTPLNVITAKMREEVKRDLQPSDPRCWILKELDGQS